MSIHWDPPHNDEGDQNGNSELVGHGYWSLGVAHAPDQWGVELIALDERLEQEVDGCVHLGYYPSAEAARAAAEEYESAHGGRPYEDLHRNCTHRHAGR